MRLTPYGERKGSGGSMGAMWQWMILLTMPILPVLLEYEDLYNSISAEELYNSAFAYWSLDSLEESSMISGARFCSIQGIDALHGGVVLQQPDQDPSSTTRLSAKITLSYSPNGCPTDPGDCADGFTLAFWLSMNKTAVTDETCMLLGLNDTSSSGFEIQYDGTQSVVSFQAAGATVRSSEVYHATEKWMWNHVGMTWNSRTQELKVFSNGLEDAVVVAGNPSTQFDASGVQGCSYLALDEIGIWDRPLNETEMTALRLDPFNGTYPSTAPAGVTTPGVTTLADLTSPQPSAAPTDPTLPDAKIGINRSSNIDDMISNLTYVDQFLSVRKTRPSDIDKNTLGDIMDVTGDRVEDLVENSEPEKRKSVLEIYMGIVNHILEINQLTHDQGDDATQSFMTGSRLTTAVDNMLKAYIHTGSDSEVPQMVNNTFVDAKLAVIVPGQETISMELGTDDEGSDAKQVGIVIPQSIFESGQTGRVAVTSYYQGIQEHLPTALQGKLTPPTVYSSVVGININTESTSNFQDKVTLTINHAEVDNKHKATCGFLQNGAWSADGCTTSSAGKTTTCACSHLTNFAVLVSPRELVISQGDTIALDILTNLGLAISIICLLMTLFILNYLRQLTSMRISILKHTAAALLIAQCLFILGSQVGHLATFCKVVAALTHYFFLAVFFWMLIQGVQLYMKVRRALKGGIDLMYFYLFGWGFPLVIVAISFGVEHVNYGANEICWISVTAGVGALIAFIGPAYFVLAINLVVICMVMHVFMTVKANKDKSEKDKIKSGLKAVIVMVPILGLSWLFGLLIITSPEVVFLYLFVIFNCSQGVFIFLFHVVFNDEVKQALNKKRNKIAASHDSSTLMSKVLKTSKSTGDHSTSNDTSSSIQ